MVKSLYYLRFEFRTGKYCIVVKKFVLLFEFRRGISDGCYVDKPSILFREVVLDFPFL